MDFFVTSLYIADAIPGPWLLVNYAMLHVCVLAAIFADSNDVPILLMIMFILYIILSYFIYMLPLLDPIIKSTALCNDATITKCMGAHQLGPTDMIPGLLNVHVCVYIYMCDTMIWWYVFIYLIISNQIK